MSRQKKYTFIDLFAGCGGLSLGLEQAGFEVVFMNEIVETFASTYLANHSLKQGQYFIGDINELNTCLDKYRDTLKNPDRPITLVCGGPPCQGFSMANRQRIIDDPRNQLYKAYLQFLSEIRPQFFIMENVKGMANKFDEIIANFKEYLGDEYLYDYRLLKVQDFGIPQNRERFIMIGNRMGVAPNDIFAEIERYKRDPFLLRDVLFGLPHLEARKAKNQGEYESEECGFTERDFSYPDTDFYHFINGDRIITKLYNHKNRYNNLRDIEQDAKVGKNTLVVRIGPKKGRIYHCILLSVAALCYVLFAVSTAFSPWHFLFLLAFPLLLKHALFVYRSKEPAVLRPMLAQMSMISLFINILFSLGLLIG